MANPFYDAWVKRVDIRHFLGTNDLADKDQPIASLLDTRCLDEIAANALRFQGEPRARRYIANPLKFVFTVTNLRGVPLCGALRRQWRAGGPRHGGA